MTQTVTFTTAPAVFAAELVELAMQLGQDRPDAIGTARRSMFRREDDSASAWVADVLAELDHLADA